MWWATLLSAFTPLSWIDLKDLSYPLLSNIPTRQKYLTLSRAHMTLPCISYSSLANSCTRPSTACVVHCSPLHSALEAGVVPACTSPVLSPVSFQVPAAQYSAGKWKGKELCRDCRYPFALQSPSCQPKLQWDQGRRILAWDIKLSTIVVISYCQTLDKRTSFDLTLYLFFFFAAY